MNRIISEHDESKQYFHFGINIPAKPDLTAKYEDEEPREAIVEMEIFDRKNQLEMLINWYNEYLSNGGILDCLQKIELEKLKKELNKIISYER